MAEQQLKQAQQREKSDTTTISELTQRVSNFVIRVRKAECQAEEARQAAKQANKKPQPVGLMKNIIPQNSIEVGIHGIVGAKKIFIKRI